MPEGIGTGLFPMRDIISVTLLALLEHGAENFAADICVTGIVVGHDALWRRDDRYAKTVVDAGQVLHRRVDATAGLGNALDFPDHRRTLEVFQFDLDFRTAVALGHGVAADIAFALQDFENALAQPRVRARHFALVAHLRITDAGQEIAERIVHRHCASLLTSSTSTGRE